MKLLTKDTLDRANAINNRLCKVKAWLAGLDETDPSGIDEESRFSPIMVSCGMARTIDFAYTKNVDTDIQRMDNQTREWIIRGIENYKSGLEKLFKEI